MSERQKIVVDTLRFAAGHGLGGIYTEYGRWARETADAIEREDFSDSWCCPLCEEVECDAGCPLAPLRTDIMRPDA